MQNFTMGHMIGRYKIVEKLGEGGMAVVYKALDTRLERFVAIKVVTPTQQESEQFLKRFEREAKALARLAHANTIHVNDYGEHEGLPFLVMEYVAGGTLSQRMGNPMPWQDAFKLLLPVARALDHAHSHNIVHRDIKPTNILFTESGEPMLSDFGIAKVVEDSPTAELTAAGMGIGTPEYMAPEQALGKSDARADIYALGVVLYELITGRKPYVGDTPMAAMIKKATEPLPRPSLYIQGLPQPIESLLMRMLERDPNNRYQSMGQFIADVEKLLQFPTPTPPPAYIPAPGAPVSHTPAPVSRTPTPPPPGQSSPAIRPPTMPPQAMPVQKSGSSFTKIAIGAGVAMLCLCLGAVGIFAISQMMAPSPTSTPTITSIPPTRTPTPRPTRPPATATPAALPAQVNFAENFINNANGWTEGDTSDDFGSYTFQVNDGILQWNLSANKAVNQKDWAEKAPMVKDFTLSVDAIKGSGAKDSSYGVVFRVMDSSNLYYFGIIDDADFQQYYVGKLEDGSWSTVINWTVDDAIVPGDVNSLKVVGKGDNFTLYINDVKVNSFVDSSHRQGTAGVSVELYNPGDEAVFGFDNFVLTSP